MLRDRPTDLRLAPGDEIGFKKGTQPTENEISIFAGLSEKQIYTLFRLLEKAHYKTGEKVSDSEMNSLSIKPHTKFPAWNYTLNPRTRM